MHAKKSYPKGTYYERKARKVLEEDEFYVVRSAGSKGIWDLVAINRKKVRLIQVKADSLPTKEEKKTMQLFQCPTNTKKELWIYKKRKWEVIHYGGQ